MKKLLLITGDIATGKSTFANILSKRYHTNMFFKDSIKEVLGDTIGFSNREENKKLSVASMELMFYIFYEFASLEKDLILESNFHKSELERLHKIAEDNGYDVLTIALFGDVEVLHERYLNRMANENRHPVHLSTTIDKFEDLQGHFSAFCNRCGQVAVYNAADYRHYSYLPHTRPVATMIARTRV